LGCVAEAGQGPNGGAAGNSFSAPAEGFGGAGGGGGGDEGAGRGGTGGGVTTVAVCSPGWIRPIGNSAAGYCNIYALS
jgi:hypothetical protein